MTSHVGSLGTNGLPVTPLTDGANYQQVWLEGWDNVVADPFGWPLTMVDNGRDLLWINTVINSRLNVFVDPLTQLVFTAVDIVLI